MATLFANSGDPDQTPRPAASDLGLHCLPITLYGIFTLQWIKQTLFLLGNIFAHICGCVGYFISYHFA